jgi:hemerythrin superfamily protein
MDATALFAKFSPSITKMIRMDHSQVMVAAHRFTADASADTKAAVVRAVCMALEIHAQLEEEIFYPALREVDGGNEVLNKAKPEHDEMKRLIAQLREMDGDESAMAGVFHELMRDVMHHVADEESVLLPAAERLFSSEKLAELGAQMTQRRLQLSLPRAGEMAMNTARSMPAGAMLVAGGLIAGAYLLGRSGDRRH